MRNRTFGEKWHGLFVLAGCPSCHPTKSVHEKKLKAPTPWLRAFFIHHRVTERRGSDTFMLAVRCLYPKGGRFNCIHQVAPTCTPTHASLDPPHSASQMTTRSFELLLHSSRQTVPILYNRPPLFLQNCHFALKDLDTHLIHGSFGTHKSIIQTASRSLQAFLHSSRQSIPILYNGPPPPIPSKLYDRQTDRQTDHTTLSVCNNKPHLRIQYCDAA